MKKILFLILTTLFLISCDETETTTSTNTTSYTLKTGCVDTESGSVTSSNVKEVYEVNETVTLTATANEGYEFSKWAGDLYQDSTTNPLTITMTQDIALYADFNESSSPIEVDTSISVRFATYANDPDPTTIDTTRGLVAITLTGGSFTSSSIAENDEVKLEEGTIYTIIWSYYDTSNKLQTLTADFTLNYIDNPSALYIYLGDSSSEVIKVDPSSIPSDTYTSDEISRISNNMGTNILSLQDLEDNGLNSSQYTYLNSNIISLLTAISNEVSTGSVPTERLTSLNSAVSTEIERLDILTNDEMTVVRAQVDGAITSYTSYGLTTDQRVTLIGIRSMIDDMQSRITFNLDLNPYYVDIYELYIAYYKESTYNLNDNSSLLSSIGVNLVSIDISEEINAKIEQVDAELTEINNYAIEANGYPDTLVTELTTALNSLKTTYEAYTLGSEASITIAEAQFRTTDITLLNSYSNIDGLSGSQELEYCNDMYTKLKNLSSSSYTGFENEYDRVFAVLEDYEEKRNAYYGDDNAGSEDHQDTTGNFLKCVSTTVNIISTYQYLKQNHYSFMN